MTKFSLDEERTARLLAIKADIAAMQVLVAAMRLAALLRKANFDPNQPRVPRGSAEGGQWTKVPGWASGRTRLAQSLPPKSSEPPPPEIPERRPVPAQERYAVVKQVANWLFRAARVTIQLSPLGRLIQLGHWISEFEALIDAYLDPPRTLEELQARAQMAPVPGYDVHHLVERAAARAGHWPEEWINAPENLVLIPRLRHWQLNR